MKSRLGLLYFLQFGVWGSYLSSFGQLLGKGGLGGDIAWFYAAVGLLALLTPALAGHIADATRKPARILGICHLCAALAMTCCWAYCLGHDKFEFWPMFLPYIAFLAFYMPTIALANTTTFSILHSHGIRPVDAFPSIRIWGTVGFVFGMWFVICACMMMARLVSHSLMPMSTPGCASSIIQCNCFVLRLWGWLQPRRLFSSLHRNQNRAV